MNNTITNAICIRVNQHTAQIKDIHRIIKNVENRALNGIDAVSHDVVDEAWSRGKLLSEFRSFIEFHELNFQILTLLAEKMSDTDPVFATQYGAILEKIQNPDSNNLIADSEPTPINFNS